MRILTLLKEKTIMPVLSNGMEVSKALLEDARAVLQREKAHLMLLLAGNKDQEVIKTWRPILEKLESEAGAEEFVSLLIEKVRNEAKVRIFLGVDTVADRLIVGSPNAAKLAALWA
jgi:hypothetical protein